MVRGIGCVTTLVPWQCCSVGSTGNGWVMSNRLYLRDVNQCWREMIRIVS